MHVEILSDKVVLGKSLPNDACGTPSGTASMLIWLTSSSLSLAWDEVALVFHYNLSIVVQRWNFATKFTNSGKRHPMAISSEMQYIDIMK